MHKIASIIYDLYKKASNTKKAHSNLHRVVNLAKHLYAGCHYSIVFENAPVHSRVESLLVDPEFVGVSLLRRALLADVEIDRVLVVSSQGCIKAAYF